MGSDKKDNETKYLSNSDITFERSFYRKLSFDILTPSQIIVRLFFASLVYSHLSFFYLFDQSVKFPKRIHFINSWQNSFNVNSHNFFCCFVPLNKSNRFNVAYSTYPY